MPERRNRAATPSTSGRRRQATPSDGSAGTALLVAATEGKGGLRQAGNARDQGILGSRRDGWHVRDGEDATGPSRVAGKLWKAKVRRCSAERGRGRGRPRWGCGDNHGGREDRGASQIGQEGIAWVGSTFTGARAVADSRCERFDSMNDSRGPRPAHDLGEEAFGRRGG